MRRRRRHLPTTATWPGWVAGPSPGPAQRETRLQKTPPGCRARRAGRRCSQAWTSGPGGASWCWSPGRWAPASPRCSTRSCGTCPASRAGCGPPTGPWPSSRRRQCCWLARCGRTSSSACRTPSATRPCCGGPWPQSSSRRTWTTRPAHCTPSASRRPWASAAATSRAASARASPWPAPPTQCSRAWRLQCWMIPWPRWTTSSCWTRGT
mmetsp:Transcript_15531/g.49072  ORF Transcript_15531/g.49072 Transcript_15531/m.49072 type:complete len:209 (+) Transcript_15531:674-1300(+)